MTRWFALWLLASVSVFALESEPPYFDEAKTDAHGTAWVFARSRANSLYSFDGAQWKLRSVPPELGSEALPISLVRMIDGTMACVWRLGDHRLAVTRHSGADDHLVAIGNGEIPSDGLEVRPFVDAQNRVWITGGFPKIYRADEKGGLVLAHDITPQEFRNPSQDHNLIHVVEDGRGRAWVWSDPFASNRASLRGVFIFTGDNAEMHDSFSTIKGQNVLAIARADDRHMWVAVANDGIYKVDIDTFGLERTPEPIRGALGGVHELFVNGDDVYAVETQSTAHTSLWRWRGGKWNSILDPFDSRSFSSVPRSWLPIKEGLLVESFGLGLWFVPPEGKPTLLSWHSGFPLEGVHALCRLTDGTFLGRGHEQFFHGAITLPPVDKPNSHVIELEDVDQWVTSDGGQICRELLLSAGRVWMVPRKQPAVLEEWDGSVWITHDLPTETDKTSNFGLREDIQGRLWVLGRSVHIYDPKAPGQWQSFPDLPAALVALKDKPVAFVQDQWCVDPQYSADHRRVAFRSGVGEINYFNGTTWQKWKRAQILDKPDSDNAVGMPWFNESGNLCVNLRNQMTWQMDDAGKWSKMPFASHFPDDIWSENSRSSAPIPPEGCVTNHPESIVVDNRGTAWLTWKGGLYKCVPGLCREVFVPDEVNPFRSWRQLREVFIDDQGDAFLLTASNAMNRFIIRPKSTAPKTTISLEPQGEDSMVARFDTHAKGTATFRWRLDDDLAQMSKESLLTLNHLGNGSHVLKVTAIDDELNMDAVPATATFEIKVDSAKQLASLIKQLGDPDFAQRKAAVEALARQPAAAEPALQAARATANDDQRWWIDAALQAIEDQKAATKPRQTQPK